MNLEKNVTVFHACRTSRRDIIVFHLTFQVFSFVFINKKIKIKKNKKGIIITVRPKRKKCIMYCYDVCVSVWACVQCSWDVLVKLAGAPLTFVSIIETGCFHQRMTHSVGFN